MIDDTKRPDSEPEFDEPVFKPDDPAPEQMEPDFSADSEPDFSDDQPRSDSEPEFGDAVFAPDEPEVAQTVHQWAASPEPDPSADVDPVFSTESEPGFLSQPESLPADLTMPEPGADELVFSADGNHVDSTGSDPVLDASDVDKELPPAELPSYEAVTVEEPEFEPVLDDYEEQIDAAPSHEEAGWVNIAQDSEMNVDPLPEKEYTPFDETPAAEVAMGPPARRRLGRTGPVWVIGGFVLVVIAGLIWLAVSRLTGPSDVGTQTQADPDVQQVGAATPTQEPATATPGPQPSPTPAMLTVGANVTVGDTGGQGVLLRAGPGRSGVFVAVIEEGTSLVVMEGEPGDASYPVEADGYLWYRMRVPYQVDEEGNPLIGWSASEFFVVAGQ